MQFGSPGAGASSHIACVVLNHIIGVDPTHVPYRGGALAMQDLIGGRIDYQCDQIVTAKPQIEGGSVKGLAILTKERSPVMPNLPTALEQGIGCADLRLDCALPAQGHARSHRADAQQGGR